MFNTETAIYDTLHDIQGKQVPRLIARIQLSLLSTKRATQPIVDLEIFQVKGILLQYIDGFSLAEIQHRTPRSEWQGIVDQALATVQDIGAHGVLNRDVRPDNFLIHHDISGIFSVIMIDFGLARLRGKEESDRQWAKAKLEEDEEGAVGLVMKNKLYSSHRPAPSHSEVLVFLKNICIRNAITD